MIPCWFLKFIKVDLLFLPKQISSENLLFILSHHDGTIPFIRADLSLHSDSETTFCKATRCSWLLLPFTAVFERNVICWASKLSSSSSFQNVASSLRFEALMSSITCSKFATFLPAPQPMAVAAPTAFAIANVLTVGRLWIKPNAMAATKLSPHPTVSMTFTCYRYQNIT